MRELYWKDSEDLLEPAKGVLYLSQPASARVSSIMRDSVFALYVNHHAYEMHATQSGPP